MNGNQQIDFNTIFNYIFLMMFLVMMFKVVGKALEPEKPGLKLPPGYKPLHHSSGSEKRYWYLGEWWEEEYATAECIVYRSADGKKRLYVYWDGTKEVKPVEGLYHSSSPITALTKVYITKETQDAILDLIRKAKGAKVEYQLQLLLKDNQIYPGEWRRGAPERLRALPGFGIFHTHPVSLKPQLSTGDIIHLLVGENRVIGASAPETYIGVGRYGPVETADVQFATRIKEYPEEEKKELIRLIPLVEMTGTPVEGLEEFYRIYNFSLGPVSVPIEVLASETTPLTEEIREGKCYELAWRFLKREQEGWLVHGKVFSGTPPRWINHAWVETLTGYVYEPVSDTFMTKDTFYKIFKAQESKRYDWKEASIMAVKSGNYGPWE